MAATFAAKAIGGRAWWPSPVDHVHARERISAALKADGKEPARATLLELCGISAATLKRIANMKGDRKDIAKIKHVSALMGDASAKGRNLAAIVLAWIDELDAAEATAAKR